MIVIAGNGKLANALKAYFYEHRIKHTHWQDGKDHPSYTRITAPPEDLYVVHVGSEERWPRLIEHCSQQKIPLIVGSTGQDKMIPRKPDFPIFVLPNFDLKVISFLHALPAVVVTLKKAGMSVVGIMESHPRSKNSVAGTAVRMAKICGFPEGEIDKVREPNIQRRLGIPEEFLDAHGYHWITFKKGVVEIQLETKVKGRESYAEGLLQITKNISSTPKLTNKVYRDVAKVCGIPRIHIPSIMTVQN